MFSMDEYLYHPFTNPELGFYIYENNSKKIGTGFVLDKIDLYHQPVEELNMKFIVLSVMLVLIGEHLQFKLLAMAKMENGLVKEITQIYSITSIIMLPIWFVITVGSMFVYPLNDIIGEWFCRTTWMLGYLHFNLIAFQSLVVAVMRYFFIIHQKKVQTYGKEKTRRFFTYLFCCIPLVMSIWGVLEQFELDGFLHVNRCYGIEHRVFLADASPLYANCKFQDDGDKGMYSKTLQFLQGASCTSRTILSILMGCNLPEAIIYYTIFSHVKRYNTVVKL